MSDKLPDEILKTLVTDPMFIEVVEHCLEESELVSNFSRIYGVDLPRKPTLPLIEWSTKQQDLESINLMSFLGLLSHLFIVVFGCHFTVKKVWSVTVKVKCVACSLVHDKSQRLSHPEIKQSLCPWCWCGGFTKDMKNDNNHNQTG